jgi:hypothetical protein
MASEKQIAANRENGKKGGVKTEQGKQAVRFNAVSHGLFTRNAALPCEDAECLTSLRDRYMDEIKPVGESETLLVERIISSTWRLRRALDSEQKYTRPSAQNINSVTDYLRGIDYRYDGWQNYLKYENALDAQIYKARRELERIQRIRLGDKYSNPGSTDASSSRDNGNTPV